MIDHDPQSHGERIPVVRLDNSEVWSAILPRLEDLVLSGRFVLGPDVEEFERAAAEAFGCRWCVGTSDGTSALMLALRAAGLDQGARVGVPTNSFYADFEAVVQAGLTPVLVDHDEDYLVSSDDLSDLGLAAVIAVHLYGLPVDMQPLMRLAEENGLWVLEDCSQGHGATVAGRPAGSIGHAAAFSAYPTKNLGAWGDAGFVTGSDPDVEAGVRSLRHHAQRASNVHDDVGSTERLDALQALVLTEKLRRLPAEVESRRRVAGWYRDALDGLGLDLPGDRGDRLHAYHLFVVRVPDRDRIRRHLQERGIDTAVHYPTPIHLQPGAQGSFEMPRTPKRAEEWAGQLLSLPMFPTLSQSDVERVAAALRTALS